jgi:hypothetical protein
MQLSEDTLQVLSFLDYTSGNNLRKRNDLGTILEIGAATGDYETIDSIIFNGKYLWNLHILLKRENLEQDAFEKLLGEIEITVAELTKLLKKLTGSISEFDPHRFNDIYFAGDNGAFRNLIDLAHDLSRLKEVQNTLKRKQKNV